MTDDTDLLPLPEWMSNYTIPADGFECDKDVMLVDRMHDYARANVARAVAPLQAEIDALRTRLEDTVRDYTNKIEALRTEAEQHLRQAMSNGAKARAAQAQADNLRTEVERLRAEVREAREFRDKLVKAIGNEQLRAFIEKYGEPVPLIIRMQAAEARAERLEAEVERLRAEVARLEVIAGYGGVSSDAPERLILASEVYDGIQSCDKWCDVRRVVDDGQPMPESATAYVRADRAERLAEALREWWSAHRPVGWTEDQHRACPHVNLATATDKALAEALLRYQEDRND